MDEHSSSQENKDGGAFKNDIPESLLQLWKCFSSDDSSDSEPVIAPRLGDRYQANVLPLENQCIHNLQDIPSRCEQFDDLLGEELCIPVTHICPFANYAPTARKQLSGDTSSYQNALAVAPDEKEDTGFSNRAVCDLVDEECVKINDDFPSIYENPNSTKILNIDGLKDNSTYPMLAVDDTQDACSPPKKRQRRRKVDWKRMKKTTIGHTGLQKCSFSSSSKFNLDALCDMGKGSCYSTHSIVPGKPSASWNEIEEELFILGLYIFGKSLEKVTRFVGTKDMGDVLAYYYGPFFRSDRYFRWSHTRKARNRKYVCGQRLVSGYRQHVLLTRITAHVSDHAKEEIAEISKAFNEGRLSLEQYVMRLKLISGPSLLVQSVGIGNGKEDLTTFLTDPTKSNQGSTVRSDVPASKAYASFSNEEILKCLTGDVRLSKARADDLFWEAVWPRLLARGWHSEQPKEQSIFCSRQCLVFMIPGLQKFSRRSLTKGIHYFDSVSDVLTKVASDPRLLEFGSNELSGISGKPEDSWASEDVTKENEQMETFTVVDTSIISVEDPRKLWETLTLPINNFSLELQGISPSAEVIGSEDASIDNDPNSEKDLSKQDSEEAVDSVGFRKDLDRRKGIWKKSSSSHSKEEIESASMEEVGISKFENELSTIMAKQVLCKPATVPNHLATQLLMLSSCEGQSQRTMPDIPQKSDSSHANKFNGGSVLHEPLTGELLHSSIVTDEQEINKIDTMDAIDSRLSDAPNFEEESYSAECSANIQEDTYTSGTSQAPGSNGSQHDDKSQDNSKSEENNHADESQVNSTVNKHVDKPEDNNKKTPQEVVLRQSKRTRPLTAKALEAYACGFYSTKRQKKGGGKALNKDATRMRSVSRLVQDGLNCKLNSKVPDIPLQP